MSLSFPRLPQLGETPLTAFHLEKMAKDWVRVGGARGLTVWFYFSQDWICMVTAISLGIFQGGIIAGPCVRACVCLYVF